MIGMLPSSPARLIHFYKRPSFLISGCQSSKQSCWCHLCRAIIICQINLHHIEVKYLVHQTELWKDTSGSQTLELTIWMTLPAVPQKNRQVQFGCCGCLTWKLITFVVHPSWSFCLEWQKIAAVGKKQFSCGSNGFLILQGSHKSQNGLFRFQKQTFSAAGHVTGARLMAQSWNEPKLGLEAPDLRLGSR